jgi:hypothetical protein
MASSDRQIFLYENRMNDFCLNVMGRIATVATSSQDLNSLATRPKCSVSPINFSNTTDLSMMTWSGNFDSERERLNSVESNCGEQQSASHLSPLVNISNRRASTKLNTVQVSDSSRYINKSTTIPSMHDSGFQPSSYVENLSYLNASALLISSPYAINGVKLPMKENYNQIQQEKALKKPTLPAHFQSTPNKAVENFNLIPDIALNQSSIEKPQTRVNFHSIHELAKSSSNCSNQVINNREQKREESVTLLENNRQSLQTNIQKREETTESVVTSLATSTNQSCYSSLEFTENLIKLSISLNDNKDNDFKLNVKVIKLFCVSDLFLY